MSEHLEKSKAALERARDELANDAPDHTLVRELLSVADIQANVSIAESLEKLADCVSGNPGRRAFRTRGPA